MKKFFYKILDVLKNAFFMLLIVVWAILKVVFGLVSYLGAALASLLMVISGFIALVSALSGDNMDLAKKAFFISLALILVSCLLYAISLWEPQFNKKRTNLKKSQEDDFLVYEGTIYDGNEEHHVFKSKDSTVHYDFDSDYLKQQGGTYYE